MEGLTGDGCFLGQYVQAAVTGKHRLKFAMKVEKGTGDSFEFDLTFGNLHRWLTPYAPGWHFLEFQQTVLQGTVSLEMMAYPGYNFYIDDVEVEALAYDPGYLWWFMDRLRSERNDLASMYHTPATYERVVQEAVAAAPLEVWPAETYATSSLVTVGGQEDYSLAAISELTRARDVLGVQLRPAVSSAQAYQDWEDVGWRTYDESAVILRFDRPWASGYEIRVVYRHAPIAPTVDLETDLDYEFLIADAMVRLLRRRPIDLLPEERVAEMQFWMREREQRRAAAEQVRPARRALTPYWPM